MLTFNKNKMNRFIFTKFSLIWILLFVNINSYSLKNSKPNELKQKVNPLVPELAKGKIHNNILDLRTTFSTFFKTRPAKLNLLYIGGGMVTR